MPQVLDQIMADGQMELKETREFELPAAKSRQTMRLRKR